MSSRTSTVRKGAASFVPHVSLLLTGAAWIIHVVPGAAAALQWDRAAVNAGEYWRVVTCHWTHASLDHLLWDSTVFLVLGWLLERTDRWRFLSCVALSTLAVSAVVALLPSLSFYRGLSGLDSALFALVAAGMLRESISTRDLRGAVVPAIMAVGFGAKIVHEIAVGSAVFVDSTAVGMIPVPLAHVAGALMGLAFAFGLTGWGRGGRGIRERVSFRECRPALSETRR